MRGSLPKSINVLKVMNKALGDSESSFRKEVMKFLRDLMYRMSINKEVKEAGIEIHNNKIK